MKEQDLLEEIGKVSEDLIAAHALPDAEAYADEKKEYIVMQQKKSEYIKNPILRRLPAIAAIAAVLVAGVIIVPKLLPKSGFVTPGASMEQEVSPENQMPDLIGMDFEEAKNTYGDKLAIQLLSQEYNTSYPSGQIFWQDIPAGDSILERETVNVKVSLGDKKVMLQDVRGWQFELAKQTILAAGLYVDKRSAYDDEVPEGDVISTDPEGPVELEPLTYVRVTVSLGPVPDSIRVPEFVGMDIRGAEQVANTIGLKLNEVAVSPEEWEGGSVGAVVEQNVESSEEVAYGTEITVKYISDGTEDSAASDEAVLVQIPVDVPANAYGRFSFTMYNLFDLGEDPAAIASSTTFEAGEGLPPFEGGTAAGRHFTPERPENGKVTLEFSSESNVGVGIMLYNTETGEKAQIGAFDYISAIGIRPDTLELDSEKAFREAGLLKE